MIKSTRPGPWPLVVTCEHATARLPDELQAAFADAQALLQGPAHEVLRSHRGYDAGAEDLARALAERGDIVPILGQVSRLVVDLNRSLHHPRLLSAVTRALSKQAQQRLVAHYWQPHRQQVYEAVKGCVASYGLNVHLAMHSFTPVWQGHPRAVDIGLLYDPKRPMEVALSDALALSLKHALPGLRVRKNQPYRGVSDGLPTALRRMWAANLYAGLEIEVNQTLVHTGSSWPQTLRALVSACAAGLDKFMQMRNSF